MAISATLARMVRETTGEDRPLRTGLELVEYIRVGLPVHAVDSMVQLGKLTPGEIDRVMIPRKTLGHRRQMGRLTPDQSDKFLRVTRIIAMAEDVFVSPEKASKWLRRPTPPLADQSPLELLATEEGARQVEALLGQIAHGIAA